MPRDTMRLRFLWVGKTRTAPLRDLADEYLERLGRFVKCEVVELPAKNLGDERAGIEDEARRIIGALHPDSFVVLMDTKGSELSSEQLAGRFEQWQVGGIKLVEFVVGGTNGVSVRLEQRADLRWSLSRLTLTHEMARVVLIEQLYRAHTIIKGLPYHK
jgi:23S rRNA (pseudouridine1915-N3)-methyltransferase